MKFKKVSTSLLALLIFTAVFFAIPVSAAGGTYTASFSVTIKNPKKNMPSGTQFTLVIEGQPHAPLPDPCELVTEVNGTYEFEPIEFTEPGNYKYTIKQIKHTDKKIITDASVYEVLVTVIRNDSGDLEGGFTISNQGAQGKPTFISFSNDYKKASNAGKKNNDDPNKKDDDDGTGTGDSDDAENLAKKEKSPPTGEPLSPAFGGLILSGALFILFVAVRKLPFNKTGKEAASDE